MAALADALGHPMGFLLPPGQTSNLNQSLDDLNGLSSCLRDRHGKGAMPLIKTLPCGPLLAGKALDKGWLPTEWDARGAIAGIPPRASRKQQRGYDGEACKGRHLMEDVFARIKE